MKVNFDKINRVRIADQNNKEIDNFEWWAVSVDQHLGKTNTITIRKQVIDGIETESNCDVPVVSQQRELLKAYTNHSMNTGNFVGSFVDKHIEKFLKTFNCR